MRLAERSSSIRFFSPAERELFLVTKRIAREENLVYMDYSEKSKPTVEQQRRLILLLVLPRVCRFVFCSSRIVFDVLFAWPRPCPCPCV